MKHSSPVGSDTERWTGALRWIAPLVCCLLCLPTAVAAQQITGTPGSPGIPEGGAEGMIVTEGGRFGGYGLFLSKGELGIRRGKPVFLYNFLDLKRTVWEGPELGPGRHTIAFDFKFDGGGFGKGGAGTLIVDGKEVNRKSMEHTVPILFPEDESFDVGQDTGTPVALIEYRYACPFKFTGKIDKLTFELGPAQYTEADRQQLPAVAERVARGKE